MGRKCKTGKVVVPFGARPKLHERTLANILVKCLQMDVVFIPEGICKSPDVEFCGRLWEIKSPVGKSSRTIENAIAAAMRQSLNIILDLRFIKLSDEQCLRNIETELQKHPQIKNLLIVMKNEKVLDRYCRNLV